MKSTGPRNTLHQDDFLLEGTSTGTQFLPEVFQLTDPIQCVVIGQLAGVKFSVVQFDLKTFMSKLSAAFTAGGPAVYMTSMH